ncbi:MAG: PH domain-containing protein [Deltaproteobacteria bacterium]|nr:PH domain-containing protein [Deltaproteobacteria bacterium]
MAQEKPVKKGRKFHAEQQRIEAALESGEHLRQLVPLRFRKIFKKCFWSVTVVCLLWGVASVFVLKHLSQQNEDVLRQGWAAWIALLLLGLLWATGVQLIYFIRYFYDIDERSIIIRKGVIAQSEVTLPFSKITDVYVDQDLLDVFFGLYDVHFSSPTQSSGKAAHIDGVDKRGAVLIRGIVLERIHREDDAMAAQQPAGVERAQKTK